MLKIPKNYRCPITNQIMVDPVFTADGHTYEHESIEEWFQTHDTSPKTGLILANKLLTPNWDKKGDIVEFIEQHVDLYETEEIYLPKTCVEQLLIAINNNQIDLVRKLLVQERRLLIYDLITQPTIVIADLAQTEESETTTSNKLISNVENTLIEDSSISNTTPLSKNTAFYFASQFGSPELLEVILEQLQRTNQLHKQLATLKPIDFRPTHLNTLLQNTLEQHNKEKFILLLQLGADIEQPADDVGNTLLHRMIINDNKEAVEFLVKHGALLESCNLEGNTPLSLAVLHGHTTIVESLIVRGANSKVVCGTEQLTPLHIAAKHGYINIVTILLQANVQIDAMDINGNTSLHLAVQNAQEKIISILLVGGAYHKARNYQNYTPAKIAKENNHPKITNLITTTARQIEQAKLEEIRASHQKIEFLESKVSTMLIIARTNIINEEQYQRDSTVLFEEHKEFAHILFIYEQTHEQIEADRQILVKFLQHVGFGEQEEAEDMLQLNPNLARIPGNFADCSKRQFNQVTGLQYAVWALDWHMWTMIKKYMPIKTMKEQLIKLDNDGIDVTDPETNVYKKSKEVSWQHLTDALQVYIYNSHPWTMEQSRNHWRLQVGSAQLILPAHVINEYCRPDRSFFPCPTFNEIDLPREGVSNWHVATGNAKLGVTFAWLRGAMDVVSADEAKDMTVWCACMNASDLNAINALFTVRTEQRIQLISSVTQVPRPMLTP